MQETFNENEEIEIDEIDIDEEIKQPETFSLFTTTEHSKQCIWLKRKVNQLECKVCVEYAGSCTMQICNKFEEYLETTRGNVNEKK